MVFGGVEESIVIVVLLKHLVEVVLDAGDVGVGDW